MYRSLKLSEINSSSEASHAQNVVGIHVSLIFHLEFALRVNHVILPIVFIEAELVKL
jgi:hypothetical protein